ncbi:MAG: V-type ATP synthase subunit E [Oryzomonas sp.]|uniref:V-type ATP synthase subunit E n=1 Tax=Oryzomonas sp. TaxID=2855186 RepID=UPI00284756A7|nr:V-type ATP synthase subunit E [Oryzomonas sp.]MDR3578694.1 V-type ATP synthase subunit E [Oryzomonas sp.]
MGYHELIASLRREGEEQADEIRRTAVAEADRIKVESVAELQALRDGYARRRADAVAAEEGRLAADSRRQAERIRLYAEAALVERLYGLAQDCLAELRDERYAGQFARLVGELLPCAWATVRVNPVDVELARSHFPHARIEPDGAISGGVRVSGEGGRLTNDNTFEKRLERCWPELATDVTATVLRLV